MRRKQVGFVAALFAVGAIALTACGQGATTSGSATPAQDQSQAQDAPVNEPETDAQSGVDFLRGTANSNKADQNSGDRAPESAPTEAKQKWVELRAGNAGGLEPAVVNGKGLSVYWFSDDPVNGGVSNCNGDCAKTWPAITVTKGTRLFFPGIRRENIGFIKRQDGQTQVTIGGRPIYLFNKDKKAGDILGQNVGGKWFVINPEGKRAVPAAEVPVVNNPSQPSPGGKPADFVTFFSQKNLKDFGDSTAVGVKIGAKCGDLPGGFQSLTTDGAVKIWSEPGCKGKSAVVSGPVNDTAAAPIGFPNGARSYIRA